MNCRLNKSKVLNQFNKAAFSYDSVAAMQRTIADELCQSIPADIAPGTKLVDLGCGTGYALQKLTNKQPELSLYGVDIAPNMLEIARTKNVQAVLCTADIEQLPYHDHFFDMVFSSSAIQWCDLNRITAEIKRVTRPGGHIYISSFVSGTLENWRNLWMSEQSQEQQGFVSYQQIEDTLNHFHFINIKMKRKTLYQTFTSFNDAVSSIKQLGAGNATRSEHTGLMSKKKYLAIRTKVEDIIAEQGQLVLPYEVVYASAIRGQH